MDRLIIYLFLIWALFLTPTIISYFMIGYGKETGASLYRVLFHKGTRGEFKIYRMLKKSGDRVLANIYVPAGNGKKTEVDLLVINRSGIYVIESKNWGGMIFGTENDKNWTQLIGRRKNQHYNPVWQNSGHISALQRLLGARRDLFRSLIVFSDECNFKNVMVASPGIHLMSQRKLKKKIAQLSQGESRLSESEVQRFYSALLPYIKADAKTKREHIQSVRNHA